MADITKEIAKKDAQKLFDSIGRFTGTRWVTSGEKGNTVVELKKIIEKYKDSSSLDLLESAYEEIYDTGINVTLKGEFSGLDSLKTRIDGLKSENPGKSLLELDLIDEGREASSVVKDDKGKVTTSLLTNVFELYNKHKSTLASAPLINEAAPNSNITLEEITKQFQGGDKTNPLDVDAINALDNSNAINLIIDNKLPLTDEARGTLDNLIKFAPEEYRNNFKSIYFKQEELEVPTDKTEEIIQKEIPGLDEDQSFVVPETEKDVTEAIASEDITPEVITSEVTTEEPVAEEVPSLTKSQKLAGAGSSLLKGAGVALDAIGGPGAIISYIMGKKGLKAAMKEVQPQASAQLSPMFMQHLRQTRELAKKGFHPDQAQKFRKELDKSYQIGLENAVRGSGGQRAKFLAQSGVLDAQRSSALLDYAVRDEELQSKNAEKYEKMMLFKENFDIQRTEKERAEDMERQVADKKAAAGFTSAAFTNLLSGFGRSSLVPNPAPGTTNLLNSIQNWGKTEQTIEQ